MKVTGNRKTLNKGLVNGDYNPNSNPNPITFHPVGENPNPIHCMNKVNNGPMVKDQNAPTPVLCIETVFGNVACV
uniref:Uncharacterized protein n=1 Tax=Anguilla anguilla TaxID=7936 RepID=A0A0E9W740_ANGAN